MSSLYIFEPDALKLVNALQAWHYRIVPNKLIDGTVELIVSNEKQALLNKSKIEFLINKQISLLTITDDELQMLLTKYYPQGAAIQDNKSNIVLQENKDEDFLSKIIKEAQLLKSSDIHIESYENRCRVRFRIDGKLVERYQVESKDYPSLINKIKIQANLDIAEKRLPQDGRILFRTSDNEFDIRVSTLPVMGGEKVVLRLLSKDVANISIERLGFSDEQAKQYKEAIFTPNGIILISGPTGSGKTTTLYATLKILNKETVNILTIEDPIEYTLEGVNQVQVKEGIDLTYGRVLRSFLRQDPDIIMLGEIRDTETAQMAVRAALTGHLVFSTIHTNSAWGTISRLMDMGIPPYLLSATMRLSMAQRLVRLLCPHCKKEIEVNHAIGLAGRLPKSITRIAEPVGCSQCFYTGYKGRKALYEIIPITPEIAPYIAAPAGNMDEILKKHKVVLLKEAALSLLQKKETSLEEIFTYI